MPWKPLPAVAFAICTYPFIASEPDDLPLQLGDHIYIIEQGGQTNEWYRGYLVAPPSILAGLTSNRGQQLEHRVFSGIFPQNCVDIREFLGEAQTNGTSRPSDAQSEHGSERRDRRRSQALHARRHSRKLSRKRSVRDLTRRTRSTYIAEEPVPRIPGAPKPLAPVPLLRVGDETGQSAEEPLVDEIASCLREWHDARLHEMLLARGYGQLAKVQELIKRLDSSRNQLMHDVLTNRELMGLREDTVWDLVAGNKMLNDEVIVRSPSEKGRILTAEDSVVDVTRLQANMSILDRPPKATTDARMLYHLLIDVHNIALETEEKATLVVSLFLKEYGERPKLVSESYAIATPHADSPAQADENKTLFVNLNGADVGIGADLSSLYVVFKLIKDEPVRHNLSAFRAPQYQPISPLNNGPNQKQSSIKGRRSVFGSQRKRDTTSRGLSEMYRPNTSVSERSELESRSSNTALDLSASKEPKHVRRVIGVGALSVGDQVQAGSTIEQTVTLWTPCSANEDRSDDADDWIEIIRELSHSPTGSFSRVSLMKRFDVFARGFPSADLDGLVRKTPTLLHGVQMSPKIGFSGVPTEPRSDIYLTISEAKLPFKSNLAHSKFGSVPLNQISTTGLANLQLTLEVRKADGERIEDCIFNASNQDGHTAWRTTGVERGEGWNQTIRLVIPTKDVPGSHVVMSIADAPNFPFALAWIPLWSSGAFVRDGEHNMTLYVYDEYSSSIVGGRGAYLGLTPWYDKNDPSQLNIATMSIRTFLCSTEHSQDPTLLGILHWKEQRGDRLSETLERFAFIPEIEIVKFLKDVFAALFGILEKYEDSKEYEDLIFSNLIVILSIARDKRFGLSNITQEHALAGRDCPYVGRSLIRAFHRLMANPMDPEASRKLRATLKAGDQMMKLIVGTSEPPLPSEAQDRDGTDRSYDMDLKTDLQKLFVAIMALLRNPMPILLGSQTLVVQHFASWLPELLPLMTPTEILEVATNLLDACVHAQGKMILHRLVLIINYSRLGLFKAPETRNLLVASTFRWLAPYWGHTANYTEQWHDQVRLCCSVVSAQTEELHEVGCQYIPKLTESFAVLQKAKRTPRRTFSMLFPSSYPFPSKPTTQEIDVDEAMLEISALIAAALTSGDHLYFDANQVDVSGVLLQCLKVVKSILSCEAFPRSWVSLLVSHHRYVTSALERIADILIDSLPDLFSGDSSNALEFDTAIWRAFFDALLTTLSSPALAMETFPEQKRRAVWKIAGDVRESGANLLRRSWEAMGWETEPASRALHGFERMGGYQVQFVPDLVGPVVELCLSVHASLRSVAVEVLRSMIIGAWEIDQDLTIIQKAMIDCLDRLCRTKSVAENVLQKTFVSEMLQQFQPFERSSETALYNAVVEMFNGIDDLLGMLANVHQGNGMNDASRLVDTLHLMELLKDAQSQEAYIRYIHQLADLQVLAGNFTEAGLTLQMHADCYQWDPSEHLPEVPDLKLPAQSAFERKEALYFAICHNYEKGQSWRQALNTYHELAHQYEHNVFDFSKLARAQRAVAGIHERIAKGHRANPRYFRVSYRGLGFPPNLRDKDFIFESSHSDRLAMFEDRMQQLHPTAQILRGGVDPEVEGQYLQIFAVSPHKNLEHQVYQRTKVSQAVREYNLMSSPHKFTTTSRQPAPEIPITEQVVEKIIYTTAEAFPTILRRSEIVKVESMTLLPIEAAIERTTRKTQELIALERRIASGEEESAMTRLAEDLLISVDPQSESSVARYRGLLPEPELDESDIDSRAANGTHDHSLLDPMQSALRISLLDHALAIRRCLGVFNRSAYLATKAEILPRFEATFQPELSVLATTVAPADLPELDNTRSSFLWESETTAPQLVEERLLDSEQPGGPGRKRYLSFLMRNKNASGSGARRDESVDPADPHDRASRDVSRSRRGSRDRSRSRRLSIFRVSFDGERPETQGTATTASMSSLRKRLSLLNDSSSRLAGRQEDGM